MAASLVCTAQCGAMRAASRPSSSRVASAAAVPYARIAAPCPQAGQQQRQRRAVAAWAGRGGGAEEESDSEGDDFRGEEGSSEEVYEAEEIFEDYEFDTNMRLYLDSANVEEWGKWAETGLFYGFTTNPTILKRDGVACNITSMRQLVREAFTLEVEELQLQAWGSTAAEMYACGMDLLDLEGGIVVKLPITLEGAKAAKLLIANGAPVTMTGVYAAHQVVSSLAMGAAYCAPYVGRMTDAGKNGMEEAVRMQKIMDLGVEDGSVRLLVASIRSADEVATLAAEGCNTFTLSPAVAAQMFDVQLTNEAADLFQEHATAGK